MSWRTRNSAVKLRDILAGASGCNRAGQTLLSETTWGGTGSDVAHGVAVAPDGSSYKVGLSDSFTTDQFGNPRPAISLVKFGPHGSLDWQKIWTGFTLRGGLRGPAVALSADGSVYVSGQTLTTTNEFDAVLLKFDGATGNLFWQRTWGGSASEESNAVATDSQGSAYIAGTITDNVAQSASLFVVKFDSAGNLAWQKRWDGAAGLAVAVSEGSVYAAGTRPRPGGIGESDLIALKMTSVAGDLVWDRTYSAGENVDPRGGMAVAPDGSIVIAGAIQAPRSGIVDIAALIIKLGADGSLLFDREWGGKSGETAAGVAVAQDGSIYVAGASDSFGAGGDAFVLHVLANGKAADAATWGGTGFDSGAGVGVAADGTVVLAATTTTAPPYSLLSAPRKVSAVRGTVAVTGGALADATGVIADPGAAAITPSGSTTFGGNFETALVRFIP